MEIERNSNDAMMAIAPQFYCSVLRSIHAHNAHTQKIISASNEKLRVAIIYEFGIGNPGCFFYIYLYYGAERLACEKHINMHINRNNNLTG